MFWSIKPCIIIIASSLSSVIYPGANLNGPPPGISIHFSINYLDSTLLLNSLYEPHESPINAPIIHPNALSSKESGTISFRI